MEFCVMFSVLLWRHVVFFEREWWFGQSTALVVPHMQCALGVGARTKVLPKTWYLDFLICLLGKEPNGIYRHLPCARHCAKSLTDLVQSSLWSCEVSVLLCSFSDAEIGFIGVK